jgi:hypothetical protein
MTIPLSTRMSADPIPDLPTDDARPPKPGMSYTQKFLFFVTAWLICLMPFLFWWNTWFGRKLSDQQLNQYLHDTKKPRHIQQALVQVGERITRQDATAKQWYPELVRLAADPVEEVRNTDAWVMGQDTSGAGFHAALLNMLADPSPMVRGNAALSLVRFGDAAGRPQILALLASAQVRVPPPSALRSAKAESSPRSVPACLPTAPACSNCAHPSAAACVRSRSSAERPCIRVMSSPSSIPEPNRCGKPCAPSISSASPTTSPPFARTSATCLIFRTMCASRLSKPSKRYEAGKAISS